MNNEKIEWFFPLTQGGEEDGYSDAGIQHFEGKHQYFLARETIQNSLDARVTDDFPVIMEFKLLNINIDEIPGWPQLKEILAHCYDYAVEEAGDRLDEEEELKNVSFFENAKRISGDVQVLIISDYNTTGLCGGDNDTNQQWYHCIKKKGASAPTGSRGGTYGIGKHAPFATTSLRTVFYSTINDKKEPAFMGKAILTSYIDSGGKVRKGTGFYGWHRPEDMNMDGIRDDIDIPLFFQRKKQGLSLFIINYVDEWDWRTNIIDSILENYYAAILNGDLIVKIESDGSTDEINKDNLLEWLEEGDPPEGVLQFYKAINDPDHTFEKELSTIGRVTLFVKKGDDYTKEVALMRKPRMVVTKLKKRILREPYAAVFICENEKGNKLLSKLEPPAHNKWDPDLHTDGRKIYREIENWIKDSLKSLNIEDQEDVQDIPDLSKYLPSEGSDGGSEGGFGEEGELQSSDEGGEEIGKTTDWADLEFKADKEIQGIIRKSGREGGSGAGGPGGRKKKRGKGKSGPGDGRGNRQSRYKRKSIPIPFRWIMDVDKPGEGNLVLYPGSDFKGDLKLKATGEDSDYSLAIHSAIHKQTDKRYEISGSLIKNVDLKEDQRQIIKLKFKNANRFVMGVDPYVD